MGYKFALFATDACIFYERTMAHLRDTPPLKKVQILSTETKKVHGIVQ